MKIVDGKEVLEPGDPGYVPSQEEIQAQVNALVEAQLKDIKEKLNGAFSARDEANKKAAALEAAARQAEMDALEKAGKHTEVANMKIAALEEDLKRAREKVTGYERDGVVREAIRSVDFRNDRSRDMAYKDIVNQLVQDKDGNWVHNTGVSIKDFITTFQKDEENSFLFKPKENSGSGTGNNVTGVPGKTTKKPSEMSTAELLAAAQAGQFGKLP